jgi:hypothetical protein
MRTLRVKVVLGEQIIMVGGCENGSVIVATCVCAHHPRFLFLEASGSQKPDGPTERH